MLCRLKDRAGALSDIAPPCDCKVTLVCDYSICSNHLFDVQQDAVDNGPYYVHMGHASSRSGLRAYFEKLTGLKGAALR